MNCYNMVLEYINKSEKGIPIYIEEMKKKKYSIILKLF